MIYSFRKSIVCCFGGWIVANKSRGREASYGAIELNLEERCCSSRRGGEQWLDMGSISNIDPIELSIDKEWTLRERKIKSVSWDFSLSKYMKGGTIY